MKSATQELVNFVSDTEFQDLPERVVYESKKVLLDALGCSLAGISVDKGKISIAFAERLGGPPESTILGVGSRVSCAAAAFANGELIQALDYDPILLPPGHVSPFVISAPLALSESIGGSGKDLVLAIAIAHEVSTRLAMALGAAHRYPEPGRRYVMQGYNMCVFGGVSAAGKVLKLNREKLSYAFGIAGYLCPVAARAKWTDTVPLSMTKHLPAGWISQAEVTAALLAEAGYIGDSTVLDGEYGFWRFSNSDMWNPDVLVEKLGKEWVFPLGVHYKRYPFCGIASISALDLFSKIIEENHLMPDDIEKVKVLVSPLSIDPIRSNRDIRSHVDAQFSIPYPFAVAAHRVRVGADWQDLDTIKNPKILEFMKKVEFDGHPGHERALAEDPKDALGLSVVEVEAKGRAFREETKIFKGKPRPRMKEEELVEKFRNNASRILTWGKVDKAVKSILELEKVENVRNLMEDLAL